MEPSSHNLARNIKQLRETRGTSQEQCARLAGIPRPTWANLESGSANPTLSILVRVATALQVSLEEMVGAPKAECRFYPSSQLRHIKRGEAVIKKVIPDAIPGCELDRFEIRPGGHLIGVPHRSGTREYLTCEQGNLKLSVAGESWILKQGDVVVFRGDQRHSYHNTGKSSAVGYSIVILAPGV